MSLQQQLNKSKKALKSISKIWNEAKNGILELSNKFPNGVFLYKGERNVSNYEKWLDENYVTEFELITHFGTSGCYVVGLSNGLVYYYNYDESSFGECSLDKILWDNYPYILNALLTRACELERQAQKAAKNQKARNVAENIKAMLVDMAINDKLPMDLNDLDASKITKLIKV